MRLALVLLAALAVSAPAGGATRPATIRLWSLPTSNRVSDRAPKGISAGDVVHQRTQLLNAVRQFGKASGASVGYDTSTATFTSRTRATVVVVVHLPGGTLRVRGVLQVGRQFSGRVVSGTGAFLGARGTLQELDDPSSPRALNVYRLTYAAVA